MSAKSFLVYFWVLAACFYVLAQNGYDYSLKNLPPQSSEGPFCGMVKPLRIYRGHPFYFDSFPLLRSAFPERLVVKKIDYIGKYFMPSQECTWTFEAAGNCTLEFQSYSFQRGDVDCHEQYFLVGDETSEQRFCGFRPPKHFLSRGKQLFLTHYKRNGDRSTRASYIRGLIRCIPQLSTPPPFVCPETSCIHLAPYNSSNHDLNVGRIDVESLTRTAMVQDRCDTQEGCTVSSVACLIPVSAMKNETQCNNENSAIVFPADPPNHRCDSGFVKCSVPGTCTGLVRDIRGASIVDEQNYICNATDQQTCLFGIRLCSAPRQQ